MVLTENYFLLRDTFYKHLRDGSNIAPTYANVFMVALEEYAIYLSEQFKHVKVWWQYIDDVFIIWTGTQSELEIFFHTLNNIDSDIKSTMTHSESSLQFLDTLIYREDNKLYTDLYAKATNRNNLLIFNCHHPRSKVKSLPYSQLLRVKRIVHDPELLKKRLDNMCSKFTTRGYLTQLVKKHRARVMCLRCGNCTQLIRGEKFIHPISGKEYPIHHFLTCSLEYISYELWCPCKLLYVGETTIACRIGFNKHKSTIRTKQEALPVSKHFRDMVHTLRDLKFSIIDHVPVPHTGVAIGPYYLKERNLHGYTVLILFPRTVWI